MDHDANRPEAGTSGTAGICKADAGSKSALISDPRADATHIGSEKFRHLRTTKPTAENLRRLLEALEAVGLEGRPKDIT